MELLLLALVSVALLSLMGLLLFLQSKSQTTLLRQMLATERSSNQSLLNQLRTTDPYSLASLNAATLLSPTFSPDDEYISHSDGAEIMRLPVGVGDELTQEDISAFGDQFIDFNEADAR